MFDKRYMVPSTACSARALTEAEAQEKRNQIRMRTERTQDMQYTINPVVDEMQKLVYETQEQNKILKEQIELLKEENERQKQQITEAKIAEKKAKRAAIWARIGAIVGFIITTAISIIALIRT